MFKMTLTLNQAVLTHLRSLPDRAMQIFRAKLKQELQPELQTYLEQLMAGAPPRGEGAFAFGGPNGGRKSRAFYYALIFNSPGLTDGDRRNPGHWIRGGPMSLENNWEVQVSSQLRETQVRIVSLLREGKGKGFMGREGGATQGGTEIWPGQFVFGKRAVPGHVLTGWPAFIQTVKRQLQERLEMRIQQLWGEAVREAWKL